ncbi:MAG TPA: VIT family protein [Candidatus Saccharimonadales bacterium]|nr:VIT family protein [Candidatus Saccharimonadales bacterium]
MTEITQLTGSVSYTTCRLQIRKADELAATKDDNTTMSQTAKLNWLRAAVLGANDGIVSIAGLVVGVAGATDSRSIILTAGLAGVVAGALSMAAGEHVSVSSQRDAERALLALESDSLKQNPKDELQELALIYEAKGLSPQTALRVAEELTDHDAFRAHAEAEHGITPGELANPWHAAVASACAFAAGSVIPMAFILLPPASIRVPVTFAGVVLALALTGAVSAHVGGARKRRAVLRVVVGGALAMLVTYGVGELFDISAI